MGCFVWSYLRLLVAGSVQVSFILAVQHLAVEALCEQLVEVWSSFLLFLSSALKKELESQQDHFCAGDYLLPMAISKVL